MKAFAAVVAIGLGLAVPSAHARGCYVTATPEPGWAGASLQVTGYGFAPDADITVFLGGMPIYDGFIDQRGGFEIEVRVPNPFPSGEAGLVVVDHTGVCQAERRYAIGEPPSPEAATAVPGWALGAFVLVGAGLGIGLAGVAIRARHDPEPSGD